MLDAVVREVSFSESDEIMQTLIPEVSARITSSISVNDLLFRRKSVAAWQLVLIALVNLEDGQIGISGVPCLPLWLTLLELPKSSSWLLGKLVASRSQSCIYALHSSDQVWHGLDEEPLNINLGTAALRWHHMDTIKWHWPPPPQPGDVSAQTKDTLSIQAQQLGTAALRWHHMDTIKWHWPPPPKQVMSVPRPRTLCQSKLNSAYQHQRYQCHSQILSLGYLSSSSFFWFHLSICSHS